jgi:hypothetical protein
VQHARSDTQKQGPPRLACYYTTPAWAMRSASQHPLRPRIRSPHPYILFNPGDRCRPVAHHSLMCPVRGRPRLLATAMCVRPCSGRRPKNHGCRTDLSLSSSCLTTDLPPAEGTQQECGPPGRGPYTPAELGYGMRALWVAFEAPATDAFHHLSRARILGVTRRLLGGQSEQRCERGVEVRRRGRAQRGALRCGR